MLNRVEVPCCVGGQKGVEMCARKSSNGPDWTDIRQAMGSLEETHKGTISISLLCDGYGDSSALRIVATLVKNGEPATVYAGGVGVGTTFPSRLVTNLEKSVFELLYRLDFACSQEMWQQERLEGT
jgi:hypothetical protein